jgi:signal transduction histidine kinase
MFSKRPDPERSSAAAAVAPPRGLGLRLSLWYAAVFVASTLLLVWLTYALLSNSLKQRDHDIIIATLREYASRLQLGGLPELARAVETEERAGRHERLFVRVLGPGQDALFLKMPPEWGDFDTEALDRGAGRPRSQDLQRAPARDREASLEVATAQWPDGTILQVGKSTETRDEVLRGFRNIVGGASLAAIVVGLFGGLVLTRSTLRPIGQLIAVVRGIIRTGRTDARVPEATTGDAVAELSSLFNVMLDRITGLVTGMRDSLDNVAHDLRTPLARFRGLAERALESGDPQAQREALADCLEESDRILATLNTLMDISEAETGTLRLRLEPVSLRALAGDAIELYGDVAEEKQITLRVEGEDVTVAADRDRLRQVFANLVDNAIKYSDRGGAVTIDIGRQDDTAVVTVRDTGIGIAPEELPRIWERLYRSDRSRTERGLGLGLSLVRAFVRAHGGSISAESRPGEGATFILTLPLSRPAALPLTPSA